MINGKWGFILAFLIYLTLSHNCIAQKIGECAVTPEIWSIGVLPEAENSNNLTTSYTSFETAKGKKIIITGKILDGNCVPISGAKVSIWQANTRGVFQFNAKNKQYFDKYFRSSGNMITDNVGNFQFITVYPGKINNFTPSIIFKVEHSSFMPMETKMFFPEYKNYHTIRSMNASIIKEQIPLLVAKKVSKDDSMSIYSFVITLKQTSSYREY